MGSSGAIEEATVDEGIRRRGCSCTAGDFFPEESFQSLEKYVRALKETPTRLMNRVLTRSLDSAEMESKAQSKNEMKRTLNWWDLIWLGMGSVIGSGIFVLTGLEAKRNAGPAVVLSYAVSGLSALLSVFCYTEFAVQIPVAGGSFAYLRVELGDFVAFIAAGNILFEYVISLAAVARSWTSYFTTLCNHNGNEFRIYAHHLSEGYNYLDPIAVVVIIILTIIAVKSTKATSRLNYLASLVHMVVILFIIIAGIAKGNTKNYMPFAPNGARGIFKASAVLYFAYVGFDAVSTLAEETKNPRRDIPIGLVGSMVITTAIYCLMAIVLCLMQPYQLIDENAPFSVAFSAVGWNWAKYIVALGALKGMTSVLLVGALGQARYLTHIARTHMLPPWFAQVDAKTGTPVNATITLMTATATIAFFTNLDILSNLLSISTLLIFMTVALALLVRRYYATGVTSPSDRNKLVVFLALILGSSTGIAIYWGLSIESQQQQQGSAGWVGYCILCPIWFLATLGLGLMVPQAERMDHASKIWSVPFVPWLPSISIAINIFLLGSIDKDSFIRYSVWTALLLVYYFFFGLHASYDNAQVQSLKLPVEGYSDSHKGSPKSQEEEATVEMNVNIHNV